MGDGARFLGVRQVRVFGAPSEEGRRWRESDNPIYHVLPCWDNTQSRLVKGVTMHRREGRPLTRCLSHALTPEAVGHAVVRLHTLPRGHQDRDKPVRGLAPLARGARGNRGRPRDGGRCLGRYGRRPPHRSPGASRTNRRGSSPRAPAVYAQARVRCTAARGCGSGLAATTARWAGTSRGWGISHIPADSEQRPDDWPPTWIAARSSNCRAAFTARGISCHGRGNVRDDGRASAHGRAQMS